ELRGAQLAEREAPVVAPRLVDTDEDPVREEPEIEVRDRDALEIERLLVDPGNVAEAPAQDAPQPAEEKARRQVHGRGAPPRAAVEAEALADPEDERREQRPGIPRGGP